MVGETADSVVVMRDGTVREAGPVDQIFANPCDAYTKALLACRPRLDVRPKRLPVIDDNKRLVGMLSLGDIAHSVSRELSGEILNAVADHHS